MNNIAVFASGNGTNAENLINYFKNHPSVTVSLVLTNNPNAGVIEKARQANVPVYIFNRDNFYRTSIVAKKLQEYAIDYLVLAGFLWLMPENLITLFTGRIINIHPALLPAYGGKGMYGMHVHRAVIENREKQSGITIHEVNEEYDCGRVFFQATCAVLPDDTAESLSHKIHELEYRYFPGITEKWIEGTLGV